MGSVWLTETANWLRAAGVNVVEYDGWQTRARSSGGYEPGRPYCVMWHHTASTTDPASDCNYMCHGADARPVANVLVARDGSVWLMAAGATNTNGKGHSMPFSRGTVPTDSMNSYAFGMEIANNGVGEPYPQAQVDAAFVVSNTINARLGNQPGDVSTHQFYAPDRKIDPAMGGECVQGTWHPRECTHSGSWLLDDLRAECGVRAGGPAPLPPEPPTPEPPPQEDWMAALPTITYGDSGADVKRMQHLLAAAGYMNEANTANYDGQWGDGTEGAKVRFDNDHGLTPSPPSDCGPKSWQALMGQ